MKYLILSAYPNSLGPKWLRRHTQNYDAHATDNPDEADIIIFVEGHPGEDPYFRGVLNHPLRKKYPHKCVLYHDADQSIACMPALSPSIEAWQYNSKHKRSAHYIARACENIAVAQSAPDYRPIRKYLYSFIGSSRTHAIRRRLLNMSHPSNTYFHDSLQDRAWMMSQSERRQYEEKYVETTLESYFVLCPRGAGPCTHRLFETLQLGRVPVIISDAWVEIPGIEWSKISIRIAERDASMLASLLSKRKEDAVEMGRAARAIFEQNFSPSASLRTIVNLAVELIKTPYRPHDSLGEYSQFFHPYHARNLLRYLWRSQGVRFPRP